MDLHRVQDDLCPVCVSFLKFMGSDHCQTLLLLLWGQVDWFCFARHAAYIHKLANLQINTLRLLYKATAS